MPNGIPSPQGHRARGKEGFRRLLPWRRYVRFPLLLALAGRGTLIPALARCSRFRFILHWRGGGSVLHVCACEATLGLFGFVLRSRVPVPLSRQNGMAGSLSVAYKETLMANYPIGFFFENLIVIRIFVIFAGLKTMLELIGNRFVKLRK